MLEAGTRETYITPKPFTRHEFLPDPTKEGLLKISETLRFALKDLNFAASEAPGYDPEIVNQIKAEGEPITAFLAQVFSGRRAADKDVVKKITGELKGQVSTLLAAADRLKGIMANTGKPEWVNIYLQPVIDCMAEVDALVKDLP